jgi:CubicO group peptidase (beta-lactamase class C family)
LRRNSSQRGSSSPITYDFFDLIGVLEIHRDNTAAWRTKIGPEPEVVPFTLKDWARFAQDQLDGVHGHGKLLKPETYRKLHTPVTGNYALGWGAKLEADGVPSILTHTGSNSYWVADIRIMPKHDMIFLVTTNAGNEAANQAMRDIGQPLKDRLKPF